MTIQYSTAYSYDCIYTAAASGLGGARGRDPFSYIIHCIVYYIVSYVSSLFV